MRRCLTLLMVLAVAVGASAAVASGAAGAGHRVHRCGFTKSPYGRIGIYVTKGHVTCHKGAFLIHRMFYVAGQSTGAGDTARYRDGWVCGGQMGYYSCDKPSMRHPKQEVQGIACHLGSVTCPKVARLG